MPATNTLETLVQVADQLIKYITTVVSHHAHDLEPLLFLQQRINKLFFSALLCYSLAWLLTFASARSLLNLPLAAVLLATMYRVLYYLLALRPSTTSRNVADDAHLAHIESQPAWKRYCDAAAQGRHIHPATVLEAINVLYNPPPSSSDSTQDPWLRYVGSTLVVDAWEKLCGSVIEEFVYDLWYSNFTNDREFPAEVRRAMNGVFGQVALRSKRVDLRTLLIRDGCRILGHHLKLYRAMCRAGHLDRNVMRTTNWGARERSLRAALRQAGKLHPALDAPVALTAYLRRMAEGMCAVLLDPRDVRRPLLRTLLREMATQTLLRPTVGLLTPHMVNSWLLMVLPAAEGEDAAAAAAIAQQEAGGILGVPYAPGAAPPPPSQPPPPPPPLPPSTLASTSSNASQVIVPQLSFQSQIHARAERSAAAEDAHRAARVAASAAARPADSLPPPPPPPPPAPPLALHTIYDPDAGVMNVSDHKMRRASGVAGSAPNLAKSIDSIVGLEHASDYMQSAKSSEIYLADEQPPSPSIGGRTGALSPDVSAVTESHTSMSRRMSGTMDGEGEEVTSRPNGGESRRNGQTATATSARPNAVKQLQWKDVSTAKGKKGKGFDGAPRASVVAAETMLERRHSFIAYKIRVADQSSEWIVLRRYSNFELLHRRLKNVPGYQGILPPKRLVFSAKTNEFVEERRIRLNEFLQTLLRTMDVTKVPELYEFLRPESVLYHTHDSLPTRRASPPPILMNESRRDAPPPPPPRMPPPPPPLVLFASPVSAEKKVMIHRGRSVSLDFDLPTILSPLDPPLPLVSPSDHFISSPVRRNNSLMRSSAIMVSPVREESGEYEARGGNNKGGDEHVGLRWRRKPRFASVSALDHQHPPNGKSFKTFFSSIRRKSVQQTSPPPPGTSPPPGASPPSSSEKRRGYSRDSTPPPLPALLHPTSSAPRSSEPPSFPTPPRPRSPPLPSQNRIAAPRLVVAPSLRHAGDSIVERLALFAVETWNTGTSLSEPLDGLIDEVFQLGSRDWFRRQVVSVARQALSVLAGDPIDFFLSRQLRLLRQEHTLARIIHYIHTSLWPGGVFVTKLTTGSPSAANAAAAAARHGGRVDSLDLGSPPSSVRSTSSRTLEAASTPRSPPPQIARVMSLGSARRQSTDGLPSFENGCPPLDGAELCDQRARLMHRLMSTGSLPRALISLLGRKAFDEGMLDVIGMLQSPTFVSMLGLSGFETAARCLFPELTFLVDEAKRGVYC